MFTRWVLILAAVGVAVVFVAGAGAATQATGAVTDRSFDAVCCSRVPGLARDQPARGRDPARLAQLRGAELPGRRLELHDGEARDADLDGGDRATNQFVCTTSSAGRTRRRDCLIVQSSSSAANSATCTEKAGDPTGTQSCRIYQLNMSGANNATVLQQVAATSGTRRPRRRRPRSRSGTTSGSNAATVNQDLKESQSATVKTGSITQQQDGYQSAGVTQHSDTGNNAAQVNQSLQLKLAATGGSSITQKQNTTGGGVQPERDHLPERRSGLPGVGELNGDPTGTNTGYLNQLNDLNASGTKTAVLNQTQGAPNTGLFGDIDQLSTGISTGKTNQSEHQTLGVSQVPPGGITQTQYGPMWWDPEQGTNPADTQLVAQSSDQHAGPDAYQNNQAQASCETTGLCTVTQSVANDKQKATNSCSDSFCDIGVTAISTRAEKGATSPPRARLLPKRVHVPAVRPSDAAVGAL